MNDLMLELYYTAHEKSPYHFSKLITELYFNHVQEDLRTHNVHTYEIIHNIIKACSETIINNEDNWLTDAEIAEIVRYFAKNVPMISLCVYMRAINNDETLLDSLPFNRAIIYKLIVDAYNEVAESKYHVSIELNDEHFAKAIEILF